MNKFIQYVGSIIYDFDKNFVVRDVDRISSECSDETLPVYTNAKSVFEIGEFKSKDIITLNKNFLRLKIKGADGKLYPNIISHIEQQLTNLVLTLDMIDRNVDKFFGKESTRAGLTFARVNVLRYVELASFNVKFARKLLFYILQKEQEMLGQKLSNPLAKIEEKWLVENLRTFYTSIKVLSYPPKKLETIFKNIPDAIIGTGDAGVVQSALGDDKVDPMNLGILPVVINPVYHIGLLYAEWQASRYSVAVEEAKALSYRLMALKELREGKTDSKLEQEIEWTEDRIKKLNFKIAKLEEE